LLGGILQEKMVLAYPVTYLWMKPAALLSPLIKFQSPDDMFLLSMFHVK